MQIYAENLRCGRARYVMCSWRTFAEDYTVKIVTAPCVITAQYTDFLKLIFTKTVSSFMIMKA